MSELPKIETEVMSKVGLYHGGVAFLQICQIKVHRHHVLFTFLLSHAGMKVSCRVCLINDVNPIHLVVKGFSFLGNFSRFLVFKGTALSSTTTKLVLYQPIAFRTFCGCLN